MGHPVLSLMESQWKPNGGAAIVEQILASKEMNKSKRAGLRVTVRDPNRKVNHLSKVI